MFNSSPVIREGKGLAGKREPPNERVKMLRAVLSAPFVKWATVSPE